MEQTCSNKSNKYGWYVAILSALVGCVLSAGFPQFSMTVGYLAEKMQVSQEILLTGDTVKSIAVVLAMWMSGICYKKLGLYKTIIVGTGVTIIPQFIYPYTNSLTVFFILKFVQGFTSIIFPVMMLTMMDWVEETQTGFVTAAFNGIFYGGAGIGATASGYIINKMGWVASYYAVGIALAVLTLVWVLTVKERPHTAAESIQEDQVSEGGKGLSIPQLLKLPKVYCLILGFIPTTFAVQAISIDLPLYGSFLGYNEIQVGSIGTAVTIGMVISCLVSGKCADLFAARSESKGAARVGVMLAGCVLVVLSVAFLLTAASKSYTLLYIAVLLFSFGGSWGLGVFYSILPDVFDGDTLPVATGFIGGFGDMMMPIAPLVVGVLFGVKGFWTMGWGVCAALALIGVLACFILIGIAKSETKQIKNNQAVSAE